MLVWNAARYSGVECVATKIYKSLQAKVAPRECIANVERGTFLNHAKRSYGS